MQTAVVGYPRIGSLRELKFALEKYFRQEINANELADTAKELRKNTGRLRKMQELVTLHLMISHIMILCLIQHFY